MRSLRPVLLMLAAGLVPAAPASSQPAIPEALEPWREWVLFGQEYRACPVLNGRSTDVSSSFICAWPGELALDVDLAGASFEQAWTLYTEAWVPLPGDSRYWPGAVAVDGEPQPAVLRGGRPTVRMPAGAHRVGGRLQWQTRPASIPVPTETGLVALTLDGETVGYPELERGALWLGLRPEAVVEEDRLGVEVYRLLSDGIPLRVATRIELDVAGQARELELDGALLPGFVGESLSSELPAELEADGSLRTQLRPGRWVLTLVARHPEMITELAVPEPALPWPAQEIWSFRPSPALRVAVLEGAPAVDSQRAGVPAEWRGLPAFAVAAGGTLDLLERSRNDASGANRLRLTRFLWLDFDGAGFTAEDRVAGQLARGWRLDMAPPYTMTMAAQGGENLLVTEGPEPGAQGVELRALSLAMSATARLPAAATLPVSGYTDRFDRVDTILHLPPAHRLLAAPGADRVVGAWLEQWRLLDIFLALVIAVAAWRLFGRTVGLVALATLVLIYHEPWAPQYAWLNVLLITALLRVVPAGRFRDWCRRYRYLSLAALGLLLVPFAASTLRLVVFPQLEQALVQRGVEPAFELGAAIANLRGLNLNAGSRTLTLADEERLETPDLTVTGTRLRRDDFSSPNATTVVTAEEMRALGVTSAAEMIDALPGDAPAVAEAPRPAFGALMANAVGRYRPGALVQTGPGLPDWAWSSYALGFDGPIDREQRFSLVIAGPWALGLWRVAAVASALLLAWLLWRSPERPNRGGPERRRGASRAGTAVVAVLAAALFAAPEAAKAQAADAFPAPQMLDELRQRLLQAAPCHPACAELTRAAVEAGDGDLAVDLELALQDAVAVPIPGSAQGWRPTRIAVDGGEQRLLYRDDTGQAWIRLDAGVRDVRLEGALPESDSISIAFPLPPRRIEVAAQGFDVAGVVEDRLPSGSLELVRQRPAGDDGANEIQPTAFPPYVRVVRHIELGLDWTVATTVQRIAPAAGAFTLDVALLPEEAVVTADVDVENGVATAVFAADQNAVSWQSRIPTGTALSLTAQGDAPWSEVWRLVAGHEWHVEHEGVPVLVHQSLGNASLATEFLPRPGETLSVTVTRPAPVTGDTIAIDNVDYTRTVGARSSSSRIDFLYRGTRASEHAIELPAGSELQSVTIDGMPVPLELDGAVLTLPVTPGEHRVGIELREPEGVGLRTALGAVDLGAGASNITTRLNLPADRWILLTFGPALGPAVLYWSELLVFVLAAVIIGNVAPSPLKAHEWLLLGLGLSTFSWPVLLLFAVWIFVLVWRERSSMLLQGPRYAFNAAQAVIAVLTLATLAALIGSIANGLLGAPNMHIVSPVGGGLAWFTDRSAGVTPDAGAISVSLWVYKAAMLAWALWLSFAVLRWLQWAYSAWSRSGAWRGKVAAGAD